MPPKRRKRLVIYLSDKDAEIIAKVERLSVRRFDGIFSRAFWAALERGIKHQQWKSRI